MGRDARISHRTGFPLSSAKSASLPKLWHGSTVPHHLDDDLRAIPFDDPRVELHEGVGDSSDRVGWSARGEGGQDDAPNRREKAGSLPVICRQVRSALSRVLVIPAVLTGHKEHLLLCEDDCERGKRQTQASAEFRASTERQRTAVVVVAHNVGDCRHDGQRDGARSAE